MKKTLLLSLLAVSVWQVSTARDPQPVNAPAPLPDGITVAPAQGFVDTSNNAYPNGLSSIGLSFTQEVIQNPDNTAPAVLYYQDFETPAEESLTTSVDPLSWQTAGVIFKEHTWVLPGVYMIQIPEGMFCFVDGQDASGERTGSEPVPALTLFYEIYQGYTVTPGSGIVADLKGAVLSFPDAVEVRPTAKASEIDFYLDNSADIYFYSYSITDNDGDGKENDVVFSFKKDGVDVTAPGIYGLNIPAGAFIYRVNGPGYPDDADDFTERTNNEILVKYTIPHSPRPEIDPDPDYAVKSFDTFMLYIPDGMQLWFVDTMGHSPLYGVDAAGNVDVTRIHAYAKADPIEEGASFVLLRLYDPMTHEVLDSFTPPSEGMYCLRTVPSLLYGVWPAAVAGEEPFTGGSDAYDYFYTYQKEITNVVDLPKDAAAESGPVYNLHGVKVAETFGPALPKGLYITGGRKVVVK